MSVQEKIRVLIVDDITETRDSIRRMLQFDGNLEVIGAARAGTEAIQLAQQTKPDVVLMDINMPDMDGITATQEIKKKVPFIQVVILSVQSDPSYMRKAMLAGARDFLTKPPMIDELTDAVRRAGILAQEERKKAAQTFPGPGDGLTLLPGTPQPKGKIVVVYSPRGGAGRTTIATNLAIALHNDNTRVALVDGNLQFGDVAIFVNEQGKNNIYDLTSRAEELDPDVVREVMVTHRASGIEILIAPPKVEMADKITGEQITKVLGYLRQLYTYVIVDAASQLTESVQAALDVADLIILVTTQDIPSIKNANIFLALTDASGIQRNRILFVMNRYDKQVAISPEQVGKSLRQEIAVVIPNDEKMVMSSVNRGIPLMLMSNKNLAVQKSILQLADAVRDRVAKLAQETAA